jgi:hypothetical protein
VVPLHIPIMNMLNNYCMLLMIMFGGMKIIALEEYADFTTLDTKKLFSKLKSHELSRKGRPNHDSSLTSKALITSAHVGGHDANPVNNISSSLEFSLLSLTATSDEQYESIPCPAGKKVPHLAQVLQGEEVVTQGLLRVQRHHPLHH